MSNLKKAPDMDEIMTLEEVAAYLKVTPRTIYRMLDESQIPAFKIRGTWRFRKDEIEAMTRNNHGGEVPQKGGK
jgi:excisionase family DNA binding protein